MNDDQIHGRIEDLVSEEHELWRREAAGVAGEADRQRLDALKVMLDQCWDLLRQRGALRDADVVEHYEQWRQDASGLELLPPARRSRGVRTTNLG